MQRGSFRRGLGAGAFMWYNYYVDSGNDVMHGAQRGGQMNSFFDRPTCEYCGEAYESVRAHPVLLHPDGTTETVNVCQGCLEDVARSLDQQRYVQAGEDLPRNEVFAEKEWRRLEFLRWRVARGEFETTDALPARRAVPV